LFPLFRPRPAVLALLFLSSLSSFAGVRNLIALEISVDEPGNQITFDWNRNDEGGPEIEISRRIEGESTGLTWVPQVTLPRSTTTWTDSSVTPGIIYEYQFFIPAAEGFPFQTAAYASCGIRAPLVDTRGKVLLVVDDTIGSSSTADGFALRRRRWGVERHPFHFRTQSAELFS
jgi:hypothetical protein